MEQLCTSCQYNMVEFYPEEEHFDSIKEYNVYCDECKSDMEEERINKLHERGCIPGIHYDFDDSFF